MPTRDTAWPQGTPCWVDLTVDDVGAARSFYSSLFGWDIQDSPPEAGGYLMALKGGRPAAGIGPKQEGFQGLSVWTTYLAADDADAVSGAVTAAGGQVLMPAFDVMDVGRMTMAFDTAGAAFGIWQAKSHTGMGVYNEDGACCWNELHTRGYQSARDFYGSVFGWTYDDVGDGQHFIYAMAKGPGGDPVCGIADDSAQPGQMPSYWLTWFASDDCDAHTSAAVNLGSTVMMGPETTPFGRMSIVQGAQGEMFGLIDMSTRGAPGGDTA